MSAADSGRGGDGNAWIVAVVVVCLGTLGYGALYSTNEVSDPAYLAGKYLGHALLVWGVIHALFMQKRGGMINTIAFVAIFLAFFAGGLISVQRQKQEAVQALSSIQQDISRMEAAAKGQSRLPTRVKRGTAHAPIASGEFGEVERFIKEQFDRIVAQRNDYLLELEAIGWDSILDANRIRNDPTLFESRAMIERAKAIVDKHEKKTAVLMQEAREHIELLNVSEIKKKDMLSGFEKAMAKSGKQVAEQWGLEKQVLFQVENIVRLLAANKTWRVEGGQILFYNDDELARFNSYIRAIQDLTQRQEKFQKSGFAELNKNIESLKNAVQR